MDVILMNAFKDMIALVEFNPIVDYIKHNNLLIELILSTHYYWNDAGVVGGDDGDESINFKAVNGQEINFGNIEIDCLHSSCNKTVARSSIDEIID